MRKSKMQILSILLVFILLLSITACGAKSDAGDSKTHVSTESANETEDVTIAIDQVSLPKENEDDLVENANNCMDIAKYDWGTSIDAIKSENITNDMVAGADYGEYNNELVFDASILDHYMGVHYEFDQNGALISTMFVMAEESSDEIYVKAFLELLDAYNQELGEYIFVTDSAVLDSIINNPVSYAAEITEKEAVQVQWTDTSNDSTLALRLTGERGYADVIVMYTCPDYYE